MKIKIIHIISGLGRGGAESALVRLVEGHQLKPGFQHVVISLTNIGFNGMKLRGIGIVVHDLAINNILKAPLAFLRLPYLLLKARPDIIQTWMYHSDLLGGIVARLVCSAPILWGIRSYDLRQGGALATRIVQRICALLSEIVPSKILCVADSSRKLHVALGYESSKFVVIPNGFDVKSPTFIPDQVEDFRASFEITPDELVIGCIGRFNPAKDHHNFIQACSLVAREVPKGRFMMVGRGLDLNNSVLADWLIESGVADRFILLGERDDVPMLLSLMDIFCSSSRTEAFPNVVGEAMVQSRPCVVTDVGDTRFLVGDTAIVVPSENPQALAKGLLAMLKLPSSERMAMGQRGRERVTREFSLSKTLDLIEAVYAEVLMQKDN